jgi:predicted O-methyltransferase YrrM
MLNRVGTSITSTVASLLYAPPQPHEVDDFRRVDAARSQLAHRSDTIVRRDGTRPTVAEEARIASVPLHKGAFLYRLVRLLQPTKVVECGTCFGVSAAYLGSALRANGDGHLVTVELSAERYQIAMSVIGQVAPETTRAVNGGCDDHVGELDGAELFFLDGSHAVDFTLRQLDEAVARMAQPGIIVIDDVRGHRPELDQMWAGLEVDSRFSVHGDMAGIGVLGLGAVRLDVPAWAEVGRLRLLQRRLRWAYRRTRSSSR